MCLFERRLTQSRKKKHTHFLGGKTEYFEKTVAWVYFASYLQDQLYQQRLNYFNMRLIYVNMQHNFVNKTYDCVNVRDSMKVVCQHNYMYYAIMT